MLQLSLGDINVTLPRIGDRMRYKTHYENFKLKMTVVGLIFTGAYAWLMVFACCDKLASVECFVGNSIQAIQRADDSITLQYC